jgi:hypothetical protein
MTEDTYHFTPRAHHRDSMTVVRSGLPDGGSRSPSVRVNLCCIVDAAATADEHELVEWCDPFSEEIAQDRYASAASRQSRSRLVREATCEGMCREQSQLKRTIATSRSDDNPGGSATTLRTKKHPERTKQARTQNHTGAPLKR